MTHNDTHTRGHRAIWAFLLNLKRIVGRVFGLADLKRINGNMRIWEIEESYSQAAVKNLHKKKVIEPLNNHRNHGHRGVRPFQRRNFDLPMTNKYVQTFLNGLV